MFKVVMGIWIPRKSNMGLQRAHGSWILISCGQKTLNCFAKEKKNTCQDFRIILCSVK